MARLLANALDDILTAIDRVATYLAGKSFHDFTRDTLLSDAVERCIGRVSEASRHIPDEIKGDHPTVPWHDIAAIGNRIRHNCFFCGLADRLGYGDAGPSGIEADHPRDPAQACAPLVQERAFWPLEVAANRARRIRQRLRLLIEGTP